MADSPLILDTGFLIALMNRRDRHHKRALSAAEDFEFRRWVTTWPILTETIHLLPARAGVELIQTQLDGLFELYSVHQKEVERILFLLRKYHDRDLDLADATLIVLAEHLQSGDILTCDQKDFSVLRWDRGRKFHNLLFEAALT